MSGGFDTAADWGGGVPGTNDDAILDPAGSTPFTVTVSTAHTVASIQTSALATLAISGTGFKATGGSGPGANHGVIAIGDGSSFTVGGSFANQGGQMTLNGASATTSLMTSANGVRCHLYVMWKSAGNGKALG